MKKSMRIALTSFLAVAIVGTAAVSTSVLRATEEGDSNYAVEVQSTEVPVIPQENVQAAEQTTSEDAGQTEEAVPAEDAAQTEETTPAVTPEEQKTEEPVKETPAVSDEKTEDADKEVSVSITLKNLSKGDIAIGSNIALVAKPVGVDGAQSVSYTWYESEDAGTTWKALKETGATLNLTVTEQNASHLWYVHVQAEW